jgi:hypothetical protein
MNGTRKSNLLGKITILFIICLFVLPAEAKYGGGTGDSNDPYLIYTAEQMNEIGLSVNWDDLDKHFRLMADIDLSVYTGKSFNIIGISYNNSFTGIFDGNGHTISNFTYTSAGTSYIGLFGYVRGVINDLGLIDAEVDAGTGDYVGSLVGRLRNGTITNCYVQGGSVSGDRRVGGLVGYNYRSTISNCHAIGSVAGDEEVGGLVGRNYYATITNCYSTASVTGDRYIGGLAGRNYYATITNSYSTGTVTGTTEAGGLVGTNYYDSKIINSYSTGSVSGDSLVGGLVGDNIGYVLLSYWDIETSGVSESDGGEGKSTAEMKSMSTYDGWGYGAAWTIDEGVDYPRLLWENAPGVPIEDSLHNYGGGSGTVSDPYLIYTAEHLNTIGRYPADFAYHYKLIADIDLSGFDGSEFNIIGYVIGFSGVFDGNGHTISNFSYTSTDKWDIGLFSLLSGVNAEIKNLGLINPDVNTVGESWDVGSLVGQLDNGSITNCYVDGGSVVGYGYVGGLVGWNRYGTISNCYATGSVFGDHLVGGLVGNNNNSIVDCYTSGNVTGGNDSSFVGGLCGKSTGPDHGTGQSRIQNCFSKATVTGNASIGGLIGHSGAIVTGCYSRGSVTSKGDYSWSIGGLIGRNGGNGSINNCYSTGSVVGDGASGLVGYNEGTVWASFWDIETSGQTTGDGGAGLTTAEMQMAITFVCWGYEPVWTIDEGLDYPRLVWENKPGELITVPCDFYGGGTGEPEDPYLIYTADHLNKIGLHSCHLDKHFRLMADVDLGGFTGTSFHIIGIDYRNPFSGVFDGNGRKIFNFIYTSTGRYNIGLFGYVRGENAEIKNLGLIDPNVEVGTEYYVGSLVGELQYGTISNCYIEGGSVSGGYSVGGLVGNNYRSTIRNCYSTCSVSGVRYVGGLVGYNYRSTIENCCSTGSVSGKYDVGGLAGYDYRSTIGNCYSKGSVSGITRVGGLAGRSRYGTITNCYSTASVSGDEEVGGLVGYDNSGSYTKSFWDNTVNSGLPGIGNTSDPNVIGESTANMQTQSTFTDAGWDFVGETFNGIEDIWFIGQQDYPHLWWEGIHVSMKLTPRTLNCRSYGNWVKAHLTLPQGLIVADVDSNRPAVLHSFGLETAPLYVFVNKDKLVQIEAAFDRQALCSLAGDWPQMLTIAGFLADGNIFLGRSKVRITHPGMKVIEELAWYWLNADCVHPDFCNGIDMNKDSMVNLLDYALLMDINVEFVTDE